MDDNHSLVVRSFEYLIHAAIIGYIAGCAAPMATAVLVSGYFWRELPRTHRNSTYATL